MPRGCGAPLAGMPATSIAKKAIFANQREVFVVAVMSGESWFEIELSGQKEIHRVLKPDGRAIHVLPSGSWRFWTNLTAPLKNWRPVPTVHGEHAGNAFSEVYYFSRRWWKKRFLETGWEIVSQSGNGLFYTGATIMGLRLSMATRAKMSRVCGSSCNIFVLQKELSR